MRSKKWQVLVLFIVFILIAVMGSLVYALNQPKMVAAGAKYFVKGRYAQLELKELTIEKIHWSSATAVKLENVRIKIKIHDQSYFLSAGSLEMAHINGLVTRKPMDAVLSNLAIVSDKINVSDMFVEAQVGGNPSGPIEVEGDFRTTSVEFEKYSFDQLKGHFKLSEDVLNFKEIESGFYRGQLKTKLFLRLKPDLKYNFSSSLVNVDLALLSEVNPNAFDGMTGLLSGDLAIRGNPGDIKKLEGSLKVPEGRMSTRVLGVITSILPKGNIIRQPLDRVLSSRSSIAYQDGLVVLDTLGKNQYQAKVNILSSEAFINLRYTYDIRIPGGLMSILRFLNLVS